ncbi:MAG TPA: tetratricopeptide repeat protein [Xanthomonadaceae bacterium]|nr:tetratricopeptide repeat protein [Xanthomonadaceae bacterium]
MLLMLVLLRLERRLQIGTAGAQPESAVTGARLAQATGGDHEFGKAHWIALLGAFVWLAHPLFVSTTLYVVQRHAMLPLTFVLLAFLSWDAGYGRLRRGLTLAGIAWIVLGVGGCSLLAGLSKANGFLAPLLVLVAIAVVYGPDLTKQPPAIRRRIRLTAGVVLGIPAALVLMYLIARLGRGFDFSGVRDFTLGERLMTQPRVLLDYIGLLLAPRAGGGGVFVEGFQASRGLFQPWTTLPAMLTVLGLITAAVVSARRMPALSFAVLFYFAAHLMESSVIMLELYFEHRNYLPAAFLGWPLARWLVTGRLLPGLRAALVLVIPVALLLLTFLRAGLWGDPVLLAAASASHNPQSVRAQADAATRLAQEGDPFIAAQHLRNALETRPDSVEIALNLIGIECRMGAVSADALWRGREALSRNRVWHQSLIVWMKNLMSPAVRQACAGLDLDAVASLVTEMAANPSASSGVPRRQNLLHLQGHLAIQQGDLDLALERFNQALDLRPQPDFALSQAADLGNAGFSAWGLRHLDYYLSMPEPGLRRVRSMQSLHNWLLHRSGYYREEIKYLRDALAKDADPD